MILILRVYVCVFPYVCVQKEAEERQQKLEADGGLDSTSKEAQAEVQAHDKEKSKHYARLGSAFAVRGGTNTLAQFSRPRLGRQIQRPESEI